jgi:hypothetical protein
MLTLDTGAPQGCVLSPHLYSLFTHDCVATHNSNSIIKFADNIAVVGLITDDDETAYRALQSVHTAELPAMQDLYTRQCQRKAIKMVKDTNHPSHRLLSLLPHGKRY